MPSLIKCVPSTPVRLFWKLKYKEISMHLLAQLEHAWPLWKFPLLRMSMTVSDGFQGILEREFHGIREDLWAVAVPLPLGVNVLASCSPEVCTHAVEMVVARSRTLPLSTELCPTVQSHLLHAIMFWYSTAHNTPYGIWTSRSETEQKRIVRVGRPNSLKIGTSM